MVVTHRRGHGRASHHIERRFSNPALRFGSVRRVALLGNAWNSSVFVTPSGAFGRAEMGALLALAFLLPSILWSAGHGVTAPRPIISL
jgi:hypothetical protein